MRDQPSSPASGSGGIHAVAVVKKNLTGRAYHASGGNGGAKGGASTADEAAAGEGGGGGGGYGSGGGALVSSTEAWINHARDSKAQASAMAILEEPLFIRDEDALDSRRRLAKQPMNN